MPVVGMGIHKIEAWREQEMADNMGVGQAPTIKEVRAKKIDVLNKEGVEILFEYVFEYKVDLKKKNLAAISFEGNVVFLPDKDEEVNNAIETWKKEKKVPVKIFVPVVNNIIRKCVSRAITLADDLNLPTPISFPVVTTESEAESRKVK
ncbi:MAG: hypothetical protein HY366_00395 [Candidatus Aenigmarchaeota archaeon]|nr:hypothetical protein [Candidatus Aenigmarchaeota archaeon]